MSESVQYAVILPTLMLVTMGFIQTGVWIHGHNVAVRAADAGADAARGSYGSTVEAEKIATRLANAGGLNDVRVTVTKGPGRVDVKVTGKAPVMLDLGLGTINETASVPVERVTQP